MTTESMRPDVACAFIPGPLPSAIRVLAVTARPGQESADLGGLLFAFRRSGADLSLLCLTRGEASGYNAGTARLESTRPWEVQAASILGIRRVAVAGYRDGNLQHYRTPDLAERIQQAISEYTADLVLVVAPETGDVADAAVARAATAAALQAGVAIAARTRPGVPGAWMLDLGTGSTSSAAWRRCAGWSVRPGYPHSASCHKTGVAPAEDSGGWPPLPRSLRMSRFLADGGSVVALGLIGSGGSVALAGMVRGGEDGPGVRSHAGVAP
jgi:LmbE family N-acetylglucosaminyl deacetylase